MDAETALIDSVERILPNKSYLSPQMTPIHRYNLFIDCYNTPCNRVDNIDLELIPQSQVYEFLFKISTHLGGKVLFLLICLFPFIDLVPLTFSAFFAYVYSSALKVHRRNQQKISDPFKRMRFDPEVCFNMGCDYYFFTIQLKQLQGFSLNYQENASQRLKLRKERGKTKIMIYNANFWASYNYFEKWNIYHWLPLAISLILTIIFNTLCILFLVKSHQSSN